MSRFRRTLGALLVCCLLVGMAGVAIADDCVHEWGKPIEKTPATCTDSGSSTKTCSKCGVTTTDYNEPKAKGHTWGDYILTKPATCTEVGQKTATCKTCGEKDYEDVKKISHQMTDWITIEPRTCTTDGLREKYCQLCKGERETNVLPKTGHEWGNWVSNPAAKCEVDGNFTRTCNICATQENKADPALKHNFGSWKTTQEVSCTKEGIAERICKLCGVKDTKKEAAWGHKFSNWSVDTPASCTKEGKEQRKCNRCNLIESRAIAKLPHKSDNMWVEERKATLAKPGLEITHCSVCGGQASSRNFAPRGYKYEIPTVAYGPLASEYPGGMGSTLRLIYLDLSYDSDQRLGLVTEDGWLIGYAHVVVANGTVRVSIEKKAEPTVMRYRAWGMFPDAATVKAVNYDNSLPFDQAVKGPGESCVIALNMISNYYQGSQNERFSDGLLTYDGEASYQQVNQQMLEMAEGSGE